MTNHCIRGRGSLKVATRIVLTVGLLSVALGACKSKTGEPQKSKDEKVVMTGVEPTRFAAVWKWKTVEKSIIEQNVGTQLAELKELAKQGIVEAIYFDTQPKRAGALGYPSIGFIVKAKSPEAAKGILDQMVFVQKNISQYELHPVGDRWLEQSPAAASVEAAQRYVTVWTTATGPGVRDKLNKLAPTQSDAVQDLWRAGSVENVYFDAVGVLRENDTQDFVFFVRANTEAEAKEILEKLPFYQEGLATYEIHRVGVLLDLR